MGEKANEMRIFVEVCGGTPVSAIDMTPNLETVPSSAEPSPIWPDDPITITFRLPKHFRCRSRKRLIKLLMANKLARNEAEQIAWAVQRIGVSYRNVWWAIWPQLFSLSPEPPKRSET